MKLSKNQWVQIGKKAGWLKTSQVDQEPPEQPHKTLLKRYSLFDQDDLDELSALQLSLGEHVMPHIMLDKAEEVEVWEVKDLSNPQTTKFKARQLLLSFYVGDKLVNDLTVTIPK